MSSQAVLRASVSSLARNTRWVSCDEARLGSYVAEVARRQEQECHDPTLSPVGDAETRIAFVLMRDATNFGSGYHPFLRKRPGLSGARSTGAALADFFLRHGAPSADWLCDVTPTTCAEIFGQAMSPPIDDLMRLFATAWNQLGSYVTKLFGGSLSALVQAAGGSAVALAHMLSEIEFFHDVYDYKGLRLPFLKRAQLACYDLSLSVPEDDRCRFHDLRSLTIFADNLVPHTLKVDGVLIFDDALDVRIDRGELIEPGSDEEIEIRALAVYATERLAALCNQSGDPVMPLQISDWLWNRGQGAPYKARPRHRTRSVHY